MAGADSPTKGDVSVFGSDPFDFGYEQRHDLFYIHNNYHLFFPKNLLEMMRYYRSVFPRWSNQNFNKMLKERNFSIKKNFSELPQSKQFELLLMMALSTRPKIILIDDFNTLDKEAQDYFLPLLKKYTSFGGTVVMTTKNAYADHVLLLGEKRIQLIKLEKPDETLVA
jgi:ABC-2 type transport system ATP-binding protein